MSNTRNKPLSLAFIGGALDSAVGYVHFTAARMDRRWDIQAGCFSLDPEINSESAATYGVESDRCYDSWQQLLEEEQGKIDAVAILTPTPSHADIVKGCLQKGVPVICEKALCTTVKEAVAIIQVRDEHNVFLAVTYNYSGYPMVRELRALIEKGSLGRILHFQVEMPQEGYLRVDAEGGKPQPQAWRLQDGPIPTLYLDLGVHLHQLIYYLTRKKPVEVIADQSSYGWFDVIDNVSCLCRYSDDVKGQVWFSKSALGHRNGLRLRIYGSKASAEWVQAKPEELLISHQDGRREILDRGAGVEVSSQARYTRFKAGHPAGFIEAFANLYEDIASCLIKHEEEGVWRSDDAFGPDLALEGMGLMNAIQASLSSSQWEHVS